VRLGTCIALELVVAAGAAYGAWLGVGQGIRLVGDYVAGKEAIAATAAPSPAGALTPQRLPRAHLEVAPPAPPRNVFGAPDEVLLAPLGAAPVTGVRINQGGTSLSLRIDFANGARAAFKPEQIHPQSDPRREIAAYRLDRLLGIGRVPPARAISFSVDELIAAAEPRHRTYITRRLTEEGLVRDGRLHGELSWWIPELRFAKLGSLALDEPEGRELWTSYLQVGAVIPDDARDMVAQIAALAMFDVLIDNPDRWTGANTRMSPDGKTLYFMDNSFSFSTFTFGRTPNLTALRRIQVFPRELVERMRALTADQLASAFALADDHGLGPLLTPEEVRSILSRRDNLMRYIDRLIEEHGEDAVLAFP